MNVSRTRIIIVEDELIVADDLESRLERLGYSVVANVSSGEEAIKKAEELKPDLVLMDIVLKKEMNGIEAADIILRHFNIPVVYLTAHSDKSTLDKVKTTNPYGYILKPFDEQELLTNIEIALNKNKIETELKLNEQWLYTTLNSVKDGIIATDQVGNIKFLNRAAEKLTGWNSEQSKGKDLHEVFNIVNEDTLEKIENTIENVMQDGFVSGQPNNTALDLKNGKIVPIDYSATHIKFENGEIKGVVVVFSDITERRLLENELIKREKLESLGVLAGGIAHDFNNILTVIVGNLSLAYEIVKNDQILCKYFLDAQQAIRRASDLSQKLLSFSKSGNPIKRTTRIADLLKDSVSFALSGSKFDCVFNISDESLHADIDQTQFRQAISNLIINSIQSIKENGLIKIGLEKVVLQPDNISSKKENFLKITIEDNGGGIPQNNINKIFDPYYTTKDAGSGLGLAIVHSVVENHKGFIKVFSKEGVGTKFEIYLPESENDPPQDISTDVKLNSVHGRILVMDDEESLRKVMQSMLSKLGCDVTVSSHGSEAIRIYSDALKNGDKFDLVVLDLTVRGGLGGIEALKKLLDIDPNTVAVASSGYATDIFKINFKEYGFKGFIPKPFDIKELSEIISKVRQ